MRVLIVGGGIAGLCAAIALRKVGYEPMLVERAPQFREVGAGISLWANAIRALDHIGAGDKVRAIGLPGSAGEFRRWDGRSLLRVEHAEFERQRGLPPSLWMMHRAELIDALASFLPRESVQFGRELTRVEQDDRGATAIFADGGTERADLLVGADGIRSAVRKSLWGDEPLRYAGYTCWRGVAQVPESLHERGVLMEIWGAGRRFGITPLPGGRIYWFAVSDEAANGVDANAKAAVTERFSGWASPVPDIVALTPDDAIIRNDISDRPPIRSWSRGRVVLIGDAAHPTTPNLGQGGCMAIEDAPVLARCLKSAESLAGAMAEFERQRAPRTASVTNDSWRLGRLAQGHSFPIRIARNWLTRLTPPRIAFARFAKLASYDTGPVS